jgi:NAD(P)-dependent dehydrogenase (short-subunit alcohol dehydrogenase family)
MDLKLADKVALVSGSTSGIGLAIATTLAQEGATTIVNGRKQEHVNQAIDRIKHSVPNAKLQGIAADLGTIAGVELLLQQVPSVNILVNNLGINNSQTFADIADETWMNMLEVNVMSGVRLSRHYLPLMLAQDWGRIIFISSESGLNVPAEMIHYGVTKTAQLALSRGLAETTKGSQVTVNAVLPGPTRTEAAEELIQATAQEQHLSVAQFEREFFAKLRPASLIQRFAAPFEVAVLVAFVASPLASAINGAALRVEGGVVRSIA